MSEPLHLKYRPKNLEDVKGQDAVVQSLSRLLDGSSHLPHTFLLTGPSGSGKTSLARIIASRLGCTSPYPREVDAATHTGIDEARELIAPLRYRGFSKGARVYIIDECHSLSSNAWQALLKTIEEPPSDGYFIFCTTERDKVPHTVYTRCVAYQLNPVSSDVLQELLLDVLSREKDLRVTHEAVDLIAREADGSPRQALVYLAMVDGFTDPVRIRELILRAGHHQEPIRRRRKRSDGTAANGVPAKRAVFLRPKTELQLVEKTWEWIKTGWLARGQGNLISLPTLYQLGPYSIRDKNTASRIAKVLVGHACLVPLDRPAYIGGKLRNQVYRIAENQVWTTQPC